MNLLEISMQQKQFFYCLLPSALCLPLTGIGRDINLIGVNPEEDQTGDAHSLNRFPGCHPFKPNPDLVVGQVLSGIRKRHLVNIISQANFIQDLSNDINRVRMFLISPPGHRQTRSCRSGLFHRCLCGYQHQKFPPR